MTKLTKKIHYSLPKLNENRGQAILTVVLIMVIALTIGLSISGRSISDLKMSTQIEESQRAFSAAEAGIEAALYSGQSGASTVGNANYNVKIEEAGGDSFLYPGLLPHDEFAQIWMVKPDEPDNELYSSDSLTIAWGNPNSGWLTDDNTPAIEVIIIYKVGSNYKFGKYVLDPRSDRSDNFCYPSGANCSGVSEWKTDASTVISGKPLQFSAKLDLSGFRSGNKIIQLLRTRLLYNENEQLFGIIGVGSTIPPQGKSIQSTGVAGETTRKVNVFEFYEMVPSIFDFGLFSVADLKKEN